MKIGPKFVIVGVLFSVNTLALGPAKPTDGSPLSDLPSAAQSLLGQKDWSAGKSYVDLPTSGCPSQAQFGQKHFKQLRTMAGCGVKESKQYSHGIFRGGAPTDAGVGCLSQFHIQAVIDLRTEGEMGSERKSVEGRKMLYYSFPMNTGSSPGSAKCKADGLSVADCNQKSALAAIDQMERLFAIDRNAEIFVHCARGEDRTGLVIGLYRVLKEKCSKSKALSEMKEYYYTAYDPLKQVWEKLTANLP